VTDRSEQYVSSTPWARGLKRAFDLGVGLIVLVILSPVLLAAMLLVKLTSPGPVFFVQVRTGRDGRPFRPFKMRTMRGGRTPDPNELVPLSHPGITPVGRVLRRLKIDELPQILNVVAGHMSLIGPRPTLPEQTREYDAVKRRRLSVRPGVTGLAQVNGNTAISWDERIKYDVYYVRRHGFLMDLGILCKTIAVIVRGEERFARPFDESPYARRAARTKGVEAGDPEQAR
jgi:lipopolysaccharide/colanic/teichoic acid biosynthesis glycosyltransferase